MQIMVRTYDEISEHRVRIEVADGERFDIELNGEYRITSQRVDSAESDGLLTNAEVKRDILRAEVEGLRRRLADVEAERNAFRNQAHTAEQHAAHLAEQLEKTEAVATRAEVQVVRLTAKVREIIDRQGVADAMKYQAVSQYVKHLRNAVRDIRIALSASPEA